jgi:hypothetical protein
MSGRVWGAGVAGLCVVFAVGAGTIQWSFDDLEDGSIPSGFTVQTAKQANALISFAVALDESAPGAESGNKVMKVDGYDAAAVYADNHVCWTDSISFDDGTLEVDAKASGDDHGYGGGMAWRIVDKDNFYALRFSASEGNLNVYKIVAGTRTGVGGGSGPFTYDTWYHIKVEVSGNTMTVWADGTQIASVRDNTFGAAGGIGLFQRANSTMTSWDNFTVGAENIVQTRFSRLQSMAPVSREGDIPDLHVTNMLGRMLPGAWRSSQVVVRAGVRAGEAALRIH